MLHLALQAYRWRFLFRTCILRGVKISQRVDGSSWHISTTHSQKKRPSHGWNLWLLKPLHPMRGQNRTNHSLPSYWFSASSSYLGRGTGRSLGQPSPGSIHAGQRSPLYGPSPSNHSVSEIYTFRMQLGESKSRGCGETVPWQAIYVIRGPSFPSFTVSLPRSSAFHCAEWVNLGSFPHESLQPRPPTTI